MEGRLEDSNYIKKNKRKREGKKADRKKKISFDKQGGVAWCLERDLEACSKHLGTKRLCDRLSRYCLHRNGVHADGQKQ